MKYDLSSITVSPDASILDGIKTIERGTMQIALVVNNENKLLGTLTDGDVRRGLLRGVALDQAISQVMNRKPVTCNLTEGREAALALMRRLTIHQIPVLDDNGKLVGLEWFDEPMAAKGDDTWIVLMAGGLGTRLYPLTEAIPKPMLPIGGRPLIETIVRNFTAQGYRRLFLSLNYKAEVFRDHFGDGSRFDADIQYLTEDKKLGTAGALSLLPERPTHPLLVMNGDLLTSINFRQLLNFHHEHKAMATMCVREYSFQVPYGVVNTDGWRLKSLQEKPTHNFFVNAGIYVIDPAALDLIPPGEHFDMPQLFECIMTARRDVATFPIREY